MVLLLDIYIGQYVEVRLKNKIVCGTVRYKGHLNGVDGDWVGVALEYPLGKHNGVWRGRHYFSAAPKHGIFTHACNIRHRQKSRLSKDNYHKINDESFVDETLFAPNNTTDLPDEALSKSGKIGCYSIDLEYLQNAKEGFRNLSSSWNSREHYPLSHPIGSSPSKLLVKNHPDLFPSFVEPEPEDKFAGKGKYFSSLNASIPHYTMPHSIQLKQVNKSGGWNDKMKRPRFLSV